MRDIFDTNRRSRSLSSKTSLGDIFFGFPPSHVIPPITLFSFFSSVTDEVRILNIFWFAFFCIQFLLKRRTFIILVLLSAAFCSSLDLQSDEDMSPSFQLSDDDGAYCPDKYCRPGQTCCTLDDGRNGCCTYQNATCCGVGNQCCPWGYVCDPPRRTCAKFQGGKMCDLCLQVAEAIISKGCAAACASLPPPANAICLIPGLCKHIENLFHLGKAKELICASLGFCSSGTCACGYCTRFSYGRCLSFPNHCPPKSPFGEFDVIPLDEPSAIPQYDLDVNPEEDVEACFNGRCEPGREGCCLTCL